LPLLSSGHLGGQGDVDNNYCLDGMWSIDYFQVDSLCLGNDEDSDACCLKRYHDDYGWPAGMDTQLHSRATLTETVFTDKSFADYGAFLDKLQGIHGDIHSFFGSKFGTHFCGSGGGAPTYEPLFPLLHTFIDYISRIRTDCYDFDEIDLDGIDDYMPYAYDTSYGNTTTPLDYVMSFTVLCDETNHKKAKLCSSTDITPRLMWNTGPDSQFGVVYQVGDFWTKNEDLRASCDGHLNELWWEFPQDAMPKDDVREEFVSNHATESAATMQLVQVTPVLSMMAIAAVAIALLRRCALSVRQWTKSSKVRTLGDTEYGSV